MLLMNPEEVLLEPNFTEPPWCEQLISLIIGLAEAIPSFNQVIIILVIFFLVPFSADLKYS